MTTNREIEAGAKAIAEDFSLPGGGKKKLARVVENNLAWFDAVEARGMTWADMARLLFAAGAKDKSSRPFSVGTLSSTVWRKRRDATNNAAQNTASPLAGSNGRKTRPTAKVGTGQPATGIRLGRGRRSEGDSAVETLATQFSVEKSSTAKDRRGKMNSKNSSTASASSKADTLSYMKRAATIRRSRTNFE